VPQELLPHYTSARVLECVLCLRTVQLRCSLDAFSKAVILIFWAVEKKFSFGRL
jgi:hypothetical protein